MARLTDGLSGRVDALERQHDQLRQALQRVELEQSHQREMLDTRFEALSKGQDMLIEKIETLSRQIIGMAGDAGASPAGRALVELASGLRKRVDELAGLRADDFRQMEALQTQADKLEGALSFARQSGLGAVLLALAAIAIAIGKFWLEH